MAHVGSGVRVLGKGYKIIASDLRFEVEGVGFMGNAPKAGTLEMASLRAISS